MLPEGWKLKSLKQIGECISGLTYSPDNITDKENGRLLVLRSSNIKNGSIVLEDNVYVDSCVDDTNLTRSKDILICVRNGSKSLIGKSAIITNPDAIGQAHGAFMSVFRSESNEYIFQLFQTSMFYRQVSADLGATINSINTNNLLKYKFPIPPLPEQKKIAQILSTWDNAISATERLLDNSQQRKKALMQQLLTGKKRLPGFEGEWEEVRLGSISNIYQPKTISQSDLIEEGFPVYGANGIIGFYSKYNHELEQVAVTCRGSTCGVVNWTKPMSWITGNAMVINVDENPSINKRLLYYILTASNLTYLISGSGQPQITGNIKQHIISLPKNKLEQDSIAHVLVVADQEIDALQKRIGHLKQEKKALMQQLLTGKRRVQVEDAA